MSSPSSGDRHPGLSGEPYPGLRSFKRSEADIFFGREKHVEKLLSNLADRSFLCITGPSGSGKSSLARTGLMTALEAGYLPGTGSDWVMIEVQPGSNPLGKLVNAVAERMVEAAKSIDDLDPEGIQRLVRRCLDAGQHNLREVLDQVVGTEGRPVLLMIDQFEELFRFEQVEPFLAEKFVDILLQTARGSARNDDRRNRVLVVITIRTDQLGNCARYSGLSEEINDSHFLTPVLDRFQLQQAIEGPIKMFGGRVEPNLTNWLLNNTQGLNDKLPLIQHALKLLYNLKTEGRSGAERADRAPAISISMEDFHNTFHEVDRYSLLPSSNGFGKKAKKTRANPDKRARETPLGASLSESLDRIYNELSSEEQWGARRIFCQLTDINQRSGDIRRPRTIDDLAKALDWTEERTEALVQKFMAGRECYLVLSDKPDEAGRRTVDVVHESVLRLWRMLQEDWIPKERSDGEKLLVLASNAASFTKDAGFLRRWFGDDGAMSSDELRTYEKWKKEVQPNAHWAKRHLSRSSSDATHDPKKALSSILHFVSASHQSKRDRLVAMSVLTVGIVLLAVVPTSSWLINRLGLAEVQAVQEERQSIVTRDLPVQSDQPTASVELKEVLGLDSDILQVSSYAPSLVTADDPGGGRPVSCENNPSLCAQLEAGLQVATQDALVSRYEQASLCTTRAWSRLFAFNESEAPICEQIPLSDQPAVTPAQSNDLFVFADRLLISNPSLARDLYFTGANGDPANAQGYEGLMESLYIDQNVALGSRWSQTNACFRSAIDSLCSSGANAFNLYRSVSDFSLFNLREAGTGLLEELLAGAPFESTSRRLSGHIAAIKIMLANQFLDGLDLEAMASAEPPADPEIVSRLWRTFDLSSDAARIIRQDFSCDERSTGIASCSYVEPLYRQAAQTLSLVIAAGRIDAGNDSLSDQVNFGVGLGALHWAEDHNFRAVAEEGFVNLDELIAETEAAMERRSSSRYPSALAMLYCLAGDFDAAEAVADQIPDDAQQKYIDIKEKVARCRDQAPDLERLFTLQAPSE